METPEQESAASKDPASETKKRKNVYVLPWYISLGVITLLLTGTLVIFVVAAVVFSALFAALRPHVDNETWGIISAVITAASVLLLAWIRRRK